MADQHSPRINTTKLQIHDMAQKSLTRLYFHEEEQVFIDSLSPADQKYYFSYKNDLYWEIRGETSVLEPSLDPSMKELKSVLIDFVRLFEHAQRVNIVDAISHTTVERVLSGVRPDKRSLRVAAVLNDREIGREEVAVIRDRFANERNSSIASLAHAHRASEATILAVLTEYTYGGYEYNANIYSKVMAKLNKPTVISGRLNTDVKEEIRELLRQGKIKQKEIASLYNVSQTTVSRVKREMFDK